MRLGNLGGRPVLVGPAGAVDIAKGSGGRFQPTMADVLDQWDLVVEWAAIASTDPLPFAAQELLAPIPTPRQVFGIGRNYAAHAAETGSAVPDFPLTFTKFPSCLTGPDAVVSLPSDFVDWEVELVVVVGRPGYRVTESAAWSHVAGVMVGQDLSERKVQFRPPQPQFSLGKSFPGFAPIGPLLVTPDELGDRDDLGLACTLNGEEMQNSRTANMIFPVPVIIARISSIVPLLPGDLIFTGTPEGVGMSRTPPRYLRPGDELVSTIEGVGAIRTRFSSSEEPYRQEVGDRRLLGDGTIRRSGRRRP